MQQTLSYSKSIGKTEYLLRVLSDNEVYAIFFGLLVRNSKLNLRKLMGKSVYILFGLFIRLLLNFLVLHSWWNDANVLNSILHTEINKYVYVPVSKILAIFLYTANLGNFKWRYGSNEFNQNALAGDIWQRYVRNT